MVIPLTQLRAELSELNALVAVIGDWTAETRERANYLRRAIMAAQALAQPNREAGIKTAIKLGFGTPELEAELLAVSTRRTTDATRGKLLYRQSRREAMRRLRAKRLQELRAQIRILESRARTAEQDARLAKFKAKLRRSLAARKACKPKKHPRLVDRKGELKAYQREQWRERFGVPEKLKSERARERDTKRAALSREKSEERQRSLQLRRELEAHRAAQIAAKQSERRTWDDHKRNVTSEERLRSVLALSISSDSLTVQSKD